MKKRIFLSLCLFPMLIGCANNPNTSNGGKEILPDILAHTIGQHNVAGNPTEDTFTLPEFKNSTFKVSKMKDSVYDEIYVDDTLICDYLNAGSRNIFATDVNRDGYREILFERKSRDTDKRKNQKFVVYDVKNKKLLLDEADIGNIDKRYPEYTFSYELLNGRVTFTPYLGNYSENSVVDHGYLTYSSDKGCYFEWENYRGVKDISLTKFTKIEEDKSETELQPSKINGKDVYEFSLASQYYMEVKLNYLDSTKECPWNGTFLSFYREDMNKLYWQVFEDVRDGVNGCDHKHGVFKYKIQMYESYDLREWEFFFMYFGFSVNTKVVA